MKSIPIIIILILILAVVIAIWCGIAYIRNKVRETSRTLFGTSDITQAAKQMKQEYSATPKSVSAMTSLLLPKINWKTTFKCSLPEICRNILIGFGYTGRKSANIENQREDVSLLSSPH